MIQPQRNENHERRHPQRLLIWLLGGMALVGLLLWLAVILKSGWVLFSGASEQTEESPKLEFTVKDLSGEAVSLSSLQGKVVLINFWATWCSPCKDEMPLLQEYYDDHKEEDFILVGINVSDDVDDARAFIEEYGYTFPVWSDPPGKVLILLNMNGLPASLVIDQQGRLVKRWIGPLAQEDLDNVVTPLIGD